VLGRDLLDMTEELEARCSSDRLPGAAFVDLRLRLFFLQRAWRHVYQGPEQSGPGAREIKYLLALHAALCDAWDREWPWNRSPTVIE
jgi:hypothetical protein